MPQVTGVVETATLLSQLDALRNIIERIDPFLEAVLDLVRAVRALFGG